MAAVATGLIAIAAAPLLAQAQVADKAADWTAFFDIEPAEA